MDELHRSNKLFAKNLKEIRDKKELSRAEASRGIGIAYTYLNSLEKGEKTPSFEMIDRICTFYQVLPYELFL